MPIGLKSTLFADNTFSYMTVSNTPNVETLQAEMENSISPERYIHQSEMTTSEINYTLHGHIL